MLTICILSHNAAACTLRCIHSVLESTELQFKIIVVDNGSNDGSDKMLKSLANKQLQIDLQVTNLGVPKGRNRLLDLALLSVSVDDMVMFLDNDVEVSKGWLSPFIDGFSLPNVGIVGIAGYELIAHGNRRELIEVPLDAVNVDVVTGYAFCVRSSAARRLGQFDENLRVFWHEDDDYCVRAIAAGYEVHRCLNPFVYHKGHQSGYFWQSTEGLQYSEANQAYLVNKWRKAGYITENGRVLRAEKRIISNL